MRSKLLFPGGVRFDKHGVVASAELPLGGRWTLATSAGAIVAGSLDRRGERWAFEPGYLAAVAVGHRLVDPRGSVPFVLLGGSLGISGAETTLGPRRAAFFAADARVAVTAGWVLGAFRPYASVRVFGGPVTWSAVPGQTVGDAYHVQPALGFSLAPATWLSIFVEGAPVLEQAVNAGLSLAL